MITITIIKDDEQGNPQRISDPAEALRIMRQVISASDRNRKAIRPSVYHSIEYNEKEKR